VRLRVKRVRLWDRFSYGVRLQIAEPQPEFGLIQLNSFRRGELVVSVDVDREDFLAGLERVLDVTIVPNDRGREG
jgi:hypothetical protein